MPENQLSTINEEACAMSIEELELIDNYGNSLWELDELMDYLAVIHEAESQE